MSRTKGGSTLKIHLAVDAFGLPVRVLVTQGTDADCTQAGRLIEGLSADSLLADKGYDTVAILAQAAALGRVAVIPRRKTVSFRELTTKRFTSSAIGSKTRSFTSNAGAALLHHTLKTASPSSPPFRTGASRSGSKYRDYGI